MLSSMFPPGGFMKQSAQEITKEVLFQKLGQTWFIFTEINEEVVYSAMPEGMDPKSTKLELFDVIEDHMKKVATHPRYTGAQAS
jgi:hypothetical protein